MIEYSLTDHKELVKSSSEARGAAFSACYKDTSEFWQVMSYEHELPM